jgi:hypothetical protein
MKTLGISAETDTWLVVDDATVLLKVKQALRENVNRYQGGGKNLSPTPSPEVVAPSSNNPHYNPSSARIALHDSSVDAQDSLNQLELSAINYQLSSQQQQTNDLSEFLRNQRLLNYIQDQGVGNRGLESYMSMRSGINALSPSLINNQMLYSPFMADSAMMHRQLEARAPPSFRHLQLQELLSSEQRIADARSIQLLQNRLNNHTMSGSNLPSLYASQSLLPSASFHRLLQSSPTIDRHDQLMFAPPVLHDSSSHSRHYQSLARALPSEEEQSRERSHNMDPDPQNQPKRKRNDDTLEDSPTKKQWRDEV